MNLKFVQMLIQKHEGYRMSVYRDTRGLPTVGCGWNLADPSAAEMAANHGLVLADLLAGAPLNYANAIVVMTDQIMKCVISAREFMPTFDAIPDDAQAVVIDMIFNMGATVFGEFKETIAAINAGNYELASEKMAKSDWYREVGARGIEDCSLMFSAG